MLGQGEVVEEDTQLTPAAAQGPWSWKVGAPWDEVGLLTPAHRQMIKAIQVNLG